MILLYFFFLFPLRSLAALDIVPLPLDAFVTGSASIHTFVHTFSRAQYQQSFSFNKKSAIIAASIALFPFSVFKIIIIIDLIIIIILIIKIIMKY